MKENEFEFIGRGWRTGAEKERVKKEVKNCYVVDVSQVNENTTNLRNQRSFFVFLSLLADCYKINRLRIRIREFFLTQKIPDLIDFDFDCVVKLGDEDDSSI